ncbi:MAG: hypothetical protein QXU32_00495 [Nitrososphaerales archaeon]
MSEDKLLVDRLRRVLNKEYVRRLLIRYFAEKGFDNFERPVYAPILQDITVRIPELTNKLEVVPYVKEINPATGQVTVGWNLFVLGTNRMSLGESSHLNINDFKNAINGPTPCSISVGQKTPAEIIKFIIDIICSSKYGVIQPVQNIPVLTVRNIVNRPSIGPGYTPGFYEKKRPY